METLSEILKRIVVGLYILFIMAIVGIIFLGIAFYAPIVAGILAFLFFAFILGKIAYDI